MMGTFAAHLPLLKERLDLGEGILGLMLLAMSGGAVLTMLFGGPHLDRFGSRLGLTLGGLAMMLSLPWIALAPSVIVLFVLFACFGAGNGLMDVAMNAHGASIEDGLDRSIMSSLHGFFSLGGMTAAAWTASALNLGLDGPTILLGTVCIAALLLLLCNTGLLSAEDENLEQGGSKLAWPTPLVMPIALVALVAFIGEGAMFDWAAVFMRDVRLTDTATAAWGFGIFSAMMAIARFTGDRMTDRFGGRIVLQISAALAIVGYITLLVPPYLSTSMIGVGLIGLGVANIIPILFATAGRMKSRGAAIAAVATFGYGGALAGPALIGFLAELTNLSIALSFAAILLIAVYWGSRRL